MRIGISCYPVIGGSGVIATELGKELAKRGHFVHLVCYSMPFRLQRFQENLFFHEVNVTDYPLFKYPPYTLTLATKMAEVARRWNLDIFHVHYAIPHATCAFLAKQILGSKGPQIITTLHGTDITLVGNDPSFYHITKFSIEASDGVTAVSNFLMRETCEAFNICDGIEVIPNFVDTALFSDKNPACEKKTFASGNEKILMHMSNFRATKRIPDVIKIFHLVQKQIPSKLLLIGDGPEVPTALSLAEQLCIKDKVIFLGQQDYVENLLCLADLFLFPSQQESFGLAALEALSCGVPVIGSLAGGLPEVIGEGESGYLVPVGDIPKMAQRAIELLQDEEKLKQFKKKARERAQKNFDSSWIVPLYEKYYEKILNSK